jgi:serine/threonine-protein kinase RsbW
MSDTRIEAPTAVTLVIPARSRYLRLARLTAAGIGADLGFGIDDIEDLRVAVDEACAKLIQGCTDDEHESDHHIELRYQVFGDRLAISGSAPCGAGMVTELHPVARELLELTADEHDFSTVDGAQTFRLVKRRPTDLS